MNGRHVHQPTELQLLERRDLGRSDEAQHVDACLQRAVSFSPISSSLQQLSGGVAAWSAGLIVHQQTPTSALEGSPTLGMVVVSSMAITLALMFNVHRLVQRSDSAVQ